MKAFSKGFAFVPLLIVLFLLIVSAVTSYVVINQGTGGYKSRAATADRCTQVKCEKEWTGNDFKCKANGYTVCHMVDTKIYGRGKDCVAKDDWSREKYGKIAYKSCSVNSACKNTNQCIYGLQCVNGVCKGNGTCKDFNFDPVGCGNNSACSYIQSSAYCVDRVGAAPSVTKTPTKTPTNATNPTTSPNKCATTAPNTCGYLNKAGCPDGVVYCSSGSSCDSDNNAANGIQGPAEGKTGKCVSSSTNTKCNAGVLCDGKTPVIGTPGQVVCGLDTAKKPVEYKCNANGSWGLTGASCTCTLGGTTGGGGNTGDGGTTGGGGTAPTDPKPSSTPSGDATLNFTLKFQGVTGEPRGGKTVPFKVKLKGSTVTDYVPGTLTADSSGKWTGSVNFSGIALGPDTKYTVYVKAGKHLQKRICGFGPTETSGGTYNCTESAIPLTGGVNNLDFSGILQLVGDLPSSTGEQNGVVDSYDISYVLNNLGNTEESKLAIGDLNFDGVIDTQDRSLIIQSLNVKYDDE